MTSERLSKQIEAVLLIEATHRTADSIATQLECSAQTVMQCARELAERYRQHNHGFEISVSQRGILLIPEKEAWNALSKHYRSRREDSLPNAALETLAIVAYSQPITVSEIERLRGLAAAHSIRVLVERKLITVTGTKKAPGSPRIYGTTPHFLQVYNLHDLSELPPLSEEDAVRFLSSH